MAKLSSEILTKIFELEKQLIEGIDEVAATEAIIFELYGETSFTLPVLEQLQNLKERLNRPYSRLSILLPRIAEYQPTAPTDVLDLLNRSIDQAQAAPDASIASVKELKSDFDLP
jgi:hypothetical protein